MSMRFVRHSISLFTFLLFAHQVLLCQVYPILTGKILDSQTKLHVPEARITIVGTRLWTLTDNTGHYIIQGVPLGSQVVGVSHPAYRMESCTILVAADRDTVVLSGQLHPRLFLMENVTVTAERDSIEGLDKLSARRVISTEDIKRDGIVDMDDLFGRYAQVTVDAGYALFVDGTRMDPDLLQIINVNKVKQMFLWRWVDAPEEYKTGLASNFQFSYSSPNSSGNWFIKPYVILIKTCDW